MYILWLLAGAVGIFLVFLLISDPFLIFLVVAAIYEHKLKKMLPETSLKGKQLFEYAVAKGDESSREVAKRGALLQWLYACFWGLMMLAFAIIFACQKAFLTAIALTAAAGFFFYFSRPFFYLWRRN